MTWDDLGTRAYVVLRGLRVLGAFLFHAPERENALGHVAYVLQGAKELFQIPKEHVAFQTDSGSFEGDYIFGAISNLHLCGEAF
ncbi:MAG: hypothetical protein ACLSHU_02050 [Oscillospiraceae bacterium]